MNGSRQPNLEWIAAVLRPQDLTALQGQAAVDFDSKPSTKLADILLNKPRSRKYSGETEFSDDDVLSGVIMSFQERTILNGVSVLSDAVHANLKLDPAKAAALALIVCAACGELEDYDRCESILEAALSGVTGDLPSEKLIRAVLLQQRCLRRRDSGRLYDDDVIAVAALLDSLSPEVLAGFQVNGITESSTDTLKHILIALQWANWSMVSRLRLDQSPEIKEMIPSWIEQARFPESEQLLLVDRAVAQEYAKFLEKQYQSRRHHRPVVFGDYHPDIFFQLVRLELLGTASVVQLRRQLAQMRLIRTQVSDYPDYHFADSLRLLRQASAETDLDIAVEKLWSEGPLSSLSLDARKILRRPSNQLRTTDLRVLRAAADLLAVPEARAAMADLMEVELPPNMAGHWQAGAVRLESLWRTIAAMANSAEMSEEGGKYLFDIVNRYDGDDGLIDRAISRSVGVLDWSTVSDATTDRWRSWISSESPGWPEATRTIRVVLGIGSATPDPVVDIRDVVHLVSNITADADASIDQVAEATRVLRDEMQRIRESAHKGSFSVGSYNAADLSVLLAIETRSDELWQSTVDLLVDNRVARADKTAAFERLARLRPPLPDSVRSRFQEVSDVILDPPGVPFPSDGEILPYPAALRFLSAYGLITSFEVFAQIGRLSGQSDVEGAREAAATIAVLADGRGNEWVLAIALQLSYSPDALTKAEAGRALALLIEAQPKYGDVVARRLTELLNHDGILIPIRILQSLRGSIPDSVRAAVLELRENHPSRQIRAAATTQISEFIRAE